MSNFRPSIDSVPSNVKLDTIYGTDSISASKELHRHNYLLYDSEINANFRKVRAVEEVLSLFYSKLLNELGQDFLDRQYPVARKIVWLKFLRNT